MRIVPGLCLTLYGVVVVKIYLNTFLKRSGDKRRAAAWLPFIVWHTLVNGRVWGLSPEGIMTEQNPGLNVMMNFITMMIVGLGVYEDEVWKRVVFSVIYAAVLMMTEGFTVFGIGYGFKWELPITIYLLISNAIMLMIVLEIRRFMGKKVIGEVPYREKHIFVLFPLAAMILYYAIYKIAVEAGTDNRSVMLWLCISAFILLALDLSIYPIYEKLGGAFWEKRNNYEYLKQIKHYRDQRDLEKTARDELERIKHDLKKNLIYMEHLLKHQEYAKMQDTLSELIGEVHEKSYLEGATGHLAADALINYLWQQSKQRNIVLHMEAKLFDTPAIKDTELCFLLGNLFENALDASDKIVQEREIWVRLIYTKGYMSLKVNNRYDKMTKQDTRGRLKSSKEGFHGFGLRSVEKIVDKYHGHMEIKEEEDIFKVNISLYC